MVDLIALLGSEDVLKRMRCAEKDKREIMRVIELLCAMTETSREVGYAVLYDRYAHKIESKFFKCALKLLIEESSSAAMFEYCLPYLLTSDLTGKEFAEDFIILAGLDKLIQGENADCMEVLLKSYLGILEADKILE